MRYCALALVFAASCSRCGGPKSAASAEELLPQRPSAAVTTAPLATLALHFAALSDRVATLPGGEVLAEYRKGLAAQLGFDPLTREGLLSAGLDPDRGAAVALVPGDPRPDWVVALPLSNPEQFSKTVQRLMLERFGAAPGAQPQTFERGGATIWWRVVRGYGLIARGKSELVAERKPSESLASVPHGKLNGQDLAIWAPEGSDLPRRYTTRPLRGDVALSVLGGQKGLSLRLVANLPPDQSDRARAALPGGGSALIELLPDAPVRLRLGVSPAQLLEILRGDARLGPVLEKLRGLDDVFGALQPGAALSVAVAKNASLAQAIDYGLDWRRKSPFETVQLVALAQVGDKTKLLKALDALAKQLPAEAGLKVARTGDDFQTTYAAGAGARFGVRDIDGKPVAYVMGGELRPEDLKRSAGAALSGDGGAEGRADFGKLADQIHALPESTYGTGPQSYVTRSVVAQVIDPLKPLRLSLALQAQPGLLDASLDVEIAAP